MKVVPILAFLASLAIGPSDGQGRRVPAFNPQNQPSSQGNRRGSTSTPSPPPTPRPQRAKPVVEDDDEEEEDPPQFECPRADGLYADPGNCKKFFLCGAHHAYSQFCPPSLYFDDKLKFCTFKTSALICGPVAEEDMEAYDASLNQENLFHCDPSKCQLPNCFCSTDGSAIPGGLAANQIPQMIMLTFSGAVNELVFDQYKKVLGYNAKFSTEQQRLNPNSCGIKGTFFINHEYSNYANIQWLASQGHEIGVHTISHRLSETWWTEKANYSDWAEEIIGMREILIKFANGGAQKGVLSRENIIGMRAPYLKPGGDGMFEMAHDFGMLYDSSLVAPRGGPPYWPFTFDYRQPFDCSNINNKNGKKEEPKDEESGSGEGAGSRPLSRSRQQRDVKQSKNSRKKASGPIDPLKAKAYSEPKSRTRRNSPYLGRPLKCPTKAYPGLWEVPVNQLFNDYNGCPNLDQCVFPSSDESEDSADIVEFLTDNFLRHYNSNRAPLQLNFHVNWFTSKTKARALNKFLDNVLKTYKDAYFVTFQQMISWMRDPQPITSLNFKCEDQVGFQACNRPHTCVLKHYLDNNNTAATQEAASKRDTRYMAVCQPTVCPQQYPWFGNHAGTSRNFKTIMQLVEEAVGPESK